MLKCEEVRELLSLYIDKELDDNTYNSVKEHIHACNDCEKELDEIINVLELCKNDLDEELPDNFKENLHNKLLNEKENQRKEEIIKRNRFIKIGSSIAACVLILIMARAIWGSYIMPGTGSSDMKTARQNIDNKSDFSGNKGEDYSLSDNKIEETESASINNNDIKALKDSSEFQARVQIQETPEPNSKEKIENIVQTAEMKDVGNKIEENTKMTTAAVKADLNNNGNTESISIDVDNTVDAASKVRVYVADYGGEIVPADNNTSISDSSEEMLEFNVRIPSSEYDNFASKINNNINNENLIAMDSTKYEAATDTNQNIASNSAIIMKSENNLTATEGAYAPSTQVQNSDNDKDTSKSIEYTYVKIIIKKK